MVMTMGKIGWLLLVYLWVEGFFAAIERNRSSSSPQLTIGILWLKFFKAVLSILVIRGFALLLIEISRFLKIGDRCLL
jgi:hypothetical protein